jgi:hypothetical protein
MCCACRHCVHELPLRRLEHTHDIGINTRPPPQPPLLTLSLCPLEPLLRPYRLPTHGQPTRLTRTSAWLLWHPFHHCCCTLTPPHHVYVTDNTAIMTSTTHFGSVSLSTTLRPYELPPHGWAVQTADPENASRSLWQPSILLLFSKTTTWCAHHIYMLVTVAQRQL